MALPVSFRWDEGLVGRIDAARGDVPRSVWVRRAVERELRIAAHAAFERDVEPEWRRLAAQVRQPGPNVENIRSSAQAKRSVGPVPKGKR